ncbi:MAG: hypothetical protein RMJ98_08245, partial [Myxococcales bacterium]|nr:hypothetical protein [Polyangiaceae bacterium]MDW8249277.1 hypothetical protein [Myxococcales bacterium]
MSEPVFPDPSVLKFGIWLVFPYLFDLGPDSFTAFQGRCVDLGARLGRRETIQGDLSMRLRLPGALHARGELDRWFIREVSALLRSTSERPEERGRNKFLFVGFDRGGMPLERGYKLGVLKAPRKGEAEEETVAEVFEHAELEILGVLTQAGAVMLIVHARLTDLPGNARQGPTASGPALSLRDAMNLTYYASLCQIYSTNTFLALIPKDLVPLVEETTTALREVKVPREALGRCLHLHPDPDNADLDDKQGYGPIRLRLGDLGGSLPAQLCRRITAELGAYKTYVATRGKVPVVSMYVIDPATTGHEGKALQVLEGLAARSLRHPASSPIVPLPLEDIEAEEFQIFRVSGSQTFYISCEGLCAFGSNATLFDERFWPQRVGSEYLLTFLLVLHQALVCQDISWKSYTDANRTREQQGSRSTRNTEALIKQFHEFNTNYNFSVVSHQYNIQRLYRCARVALGVERTIGGIHSELMAWLEAESREEQQALNSLA